MSEVVPIRGDKVPCASCGIPFKPAHPITVCPQCARWKEITERVHGAAKLLHPQKDA